MMFRPFPRSSLASYRILVAMMLSLLFASGVGAADLIYVSLSSSNKVVTFDVSSGVPATIEASISDFASGFSTPAGLAFDQNGNLYVSNNGSGNISRVTSNGSSVDHNWATANTVVAVNGLAFDSSGNLYAGSPGNYISRVGPTGGALAEWATGFSMPEDLAFDSSGNLYAANYSGGTVKRVGPAGGESSPWAAGFNQPFGLAFDSNGYLYVSNYNLGSISKVSPDGSNVNHDWVTGLGSGTQSLTFDSNGNLYVVVGGSIAKVDSAGNEIFRFQAGPVLSNPLGIAFLPVPEPSTYLLGGIAAFTIGCLARRSQKARISKA